MRRLITYIIIIAFFGSCSNYTQEDINDFLYEESFLLVNKDHDTIQIEFLDNCLEIYSWDFHIHDEWKVIKHESEIYLFLDGDKYKLKSKSRNEVVFINDNTEFKLIRVNKKEIEPDFIIGKWFEEKYISLHTDTLLLPPPPCPNYMIDTFLIPGVEFRESSCIINDFCYKHELTYKTNLKFGIIRFGEHCTSTMQWKIIRLTKDTMIINRRYRENSEIKYEENKILIKHGG